MLVKICGMTRQEDLDAASEFGADLCGFIFHPKSPRNIAPKAVAALDSGPMRRVGVFVEQDAETIMTIMDEARLDFAQLHGRQDVECAMRIGHGHVIRAVWPARFANSDLLHKHLQEWAGACAMFSLDSGLAGGGSGKTQDWGSLACLRPPKPWLLAGGLSAANTGTALAMCRPDGLEFNSAIEDDPGKKNRDKMAAAIAQARLRQSDGL